MNSFQKIYKYLSTAKERKIAEMKAKKKAELAAKHDKLVAEVREFIKKYEAESTAVLPNSFTQFKINQEVQAEKAKIEAFKEECKEAGVVCDDVMPDTDEFIIFFVLVMTIFVLIASVAKIIIR